MATRRSSSSLEADHGPAAVERFDTKTGVLKDRIMASAIQDGRPDWAEGFEE